MKKHLVMILALSALFMTGCCTTPRLAKWEYNVATPELPRAEGPQAVREAQQAFLNKLGKEGWVLVSQTDGRVFYFRRPVR
jgi:hypothetical protein